MSGVVRWFMSTTRKTTMSGRPDRRNVVRETKLLPASRCIR